MAKLHITLSESNIQYAHEYIQQQFDRHTWWPTEQPGVAQQEFKLMGGSADAFGVWCEKWLSSSQIRQLEKTLQKKT